MIEFSVRTPAREAFVDITQQVRDALRGHGSGEGVLHVFVPHTTAGVTINEGADPSVAQDLLATLSRLVPRDAGYRHREGNADAHVKTTLVGSHVAVPFAGERLHLGTWQSIYLAEFDGPRTRRVWLQASHDGET
jgi:secondary thiamine-phosphate synthase enzyme